MKLLNYARGRIRWPGLTSTETVEVTVVRLNRGQTMTVVLLDNPPNSVLVKGDVVKVDQLQWVNDHE